MDIGKAFTFVFDDPNWVAKLLIGGGIMFVGVLLSWLLGIPLLVAGALLLGYSLFVTRNVAEGVPTPLPEWKDFGALFMKGLYALVGIIIYFIPAIILSCCLGVFSAIGGNSASTSGGSAGDTVTGIVSIVALCLNCLISLYSLVAGLTMYAPMTRFAMTNQLSVFWDVSGTLDFITKNFGNYVIAVLIAIVASIIASFGLILCGIGIFFTSFWSYLVGSYMFGQVWRNQAGAAPMYTPMTPMTSG